MRSEQSRMDLMEEFPELQDPTLVLQKEVYAHFGLTFYQFALVEHSLINIVTFNHAGERLLQRIVRTPEQWTKAVDDGEKLAIGQTFGNLVKKTAGVPEFTDCANSLTEIKRLRDYFAHHFMREEAALFGSDDGCWFALEKMREVRLKTLQLEEDLKPRFQAMCSRYHIPQPAEETLAALTTVFLSERADSLQDGTAKMGWEADAL